MDGAAGRIVRPYAVSNGRTRPTADLGPLVSLAATGSAPPVRLGPEHRQVVELCAVPRPVTEVVGRLRLPVAVTKVLIGDLLDCGVLTVLAPAPHDDTELALLEAVLAGLRRSL
ncbi:DUF742 domain-containing protein [Streptomyces sp. TS71-3]|uniref:DUF742 domain-containing protein n=1 Tax=Streptomyces sp. TS71-3 TaxID=2733862 RepID=UPI002016B0CE|nr:DUF742 domain-containing protein [Streptomyces sp. TS71-3]